MRRPLAGLLAVLFVFGLAGVSTAGMMDTLKGQAEETKKEAQGTMQKKEAESKKAIEAKEATKPQAGGMMDQVKEGAKEKVNETIDNIGK
jgi:hypothetical protein